MFSNGSHEDPGERAVVPSDAPLGWRSRGTTTGCSARRRRCSQTTGTSFRLGSSGTTLVSIVFLLVPRAARWEHVGVTRAVLRICFGCIKVPRGRRFMHRPPAVHQLLYLVHRSARLFLQWVIYHRVRAISVYFFTHSLRSVLVVRIELVGAPLV